MSDRATPEATGGASTFARIALYAALLLVVAAAPLLRYVVHAPAPAIFLAGAVAIAVLADGVRRATEQAAAKVGQAIGGLLNVSFGSLAEIILALFVLAEGKVEVVRAQITGSILGTSLLGLGLAIVVGGIGRDRQRFNRERAGLLSSLLIIVLIALLLPAVFDLTSRAVAGHRPSGLTAEELSIGVAIVMLSIYAANLVYTLITHRDVFTSDEARDAGGGWPIWVSIAVLALAVVVIGVESELVSGALEATSSQLGLSPVFVGVIVLALVGTASDLFAAAFFARQGKMGLVLSICIGSAVQIALVVAPLLVLVSWLMGHPMTLVFGNPLDLFGIASTAFIVNAIASDGETTWFEGVLLIGVYILFGLAFFFVGSP